MICGKASLEELVDRTDVDGRRHGLPSFLILHLVFTATQLAHEELISQGAQHGGIRVRH